MSDQVQLWLWSIVVLAFIGFGIAMYPSCKSNEVAVRSFFSFVCVEGHR